MPIAPPVGTRDAQVSSPSEASSPSKICGIRILALHGLTLSFRSGFKKLYFQYGDLCPQFCPHATGSFCSKVVRAASSCFSMSCLVEGTLRLLISSVVNIQRG
ncbi:hypothetical protein L873DRAFT_1238822 [Choiromyces venosus 120613-1]|uniref:Uncharacterized protein n=1 Tax=Choiromyces venosus 120613-1 TaxID=1336337 RepID=A0A3N4JRE9_9PEZI|nr:hypothetical protein L873DRAFT_1238822 [Choiromyces venosus 120613-1]